MMEREKGRSRKRLRRSLGLMNFLQRKGRRCCAFVLCFTMIVGNTASLAAAAVKQEGDVLFRLDRESLYAALQAAVLRNQVANEDFEFSGEAADDYEVLLGEMSNDMGELYELKREQSEDSNSSENEELSLRIFARLDGGIPLMDEEMTEEYEITGNEQFIFLLTNRTDKKQTAEIQVDDKKTEVITVLPGSSVDVREEETDKAEETETEKTDGDKTGGDKTSGGSSSGGSDGVKATDEDKAGQETESESVQEIEETTEKEKESVSEEEAAEQEEVSSEDETDEEEAGSEEESAEEETAEKETTEAEETTEEETAKEETDTEEDRKSVV